MSISSRQYMILIIFLFFLFSMSMKKKLYMILINKRNLLVLIVNVKKKICDFDQFFFFLFSLSSFFQSCRSVHQESLRRRFHQQNWQTAHKKRQHPILLQLITFWGFFKNIKKATTHFIATHYFLGIFQKYKKGNNPFGNLCKYIMLQIIPIFNSENFSPQFSSQKQDYQRLI